MYNHTLSLDVRRAWQTIRKSSVASDDDDLLTAERGELKPGERTPLLSASTTPISAISNQSQSSFWSVQSPPSEGSVTSDDEDDDKSDIEPLILKRPQATPPPPQPVQQSPLLGNSPTIIISNGTNKPDEPQITPSNISSRKLSISTVLWAMVLTPVYSVLIFLPMLPFWTFAGFMIYLLGATTSTANFYLYVGCLAVLLPFNVVGTAYMVRHVWNDLYGE